MNQASEDPIRQLQERQAEIERRILDIERYISPLKFAQLEMESGRVFKRLDDIQDSVNTVKTQMEGARADVTIVKANHSEVKGYLEDHKQRLESIEQRLETHTEVLGQIMNFGEETKNIQSDHTKRFDKIDSTLAEILDRLPPKQ